MLHSLSSNACFLSNPDLDIAVNGGMVIVIIVGIYVYKLNSDNHQRHPSMLIHIQLNINYQTTNST